MKIRGITVGTTIKPEKVLVKSENLTEEEKAIARANIGAASADTIGDIETALDAILVIQNELIGESQEPLPSNMIEFTIDDIQYSVPIGTTWGEFADTNPHLQRVCELCGEIYYCELDYYDDDNVVYTFTHEPCNGQSMRIYKDRRNEESYVLSDDIIESGCAYECVAW